ncbi:ergothioneine biosynthesis protein EgtB [Beggiatoa alba]|nr:ergothioneine biosynthesis protein EgtB [Beggiatoa alba]
MGSISAFPLTSRLPQSDLLQDYQQVRQDSDAICAPLEIEDYGIQSITAVSPPKWHLAHTSWFFETFILKPFLKNYHAFNPLFAHLFNSYYELAGTFHPQPERGLLSRPTVNEIYIYRAHINTFMQALLENKQHPDFDTIQLRTIIGLHHEQQHQELLLTDIKHIFATNPLKPVYRELNTPIKTPAIDIKWHEQPGGLYKIGVNFSELFAYDNETPCHKQYLQPFRIASRLVTNAEYLAFLEDKGYQRPELWLSDGWKAVKEHHWQHPLYWEQHNGNWYEMTLGGLRPLDQHAPVCHLSLYEAAAYACWTNKRLPTEAEWEVVAKTLPVKGNLREQDNLQPVASKQKSLTQFYGDVWEWTQSSYSAYPGYKADSGALGEYNGKFMSNQMVLRGGSCLTPCNHIRPSYRNFFYPKDRWQVTGIRLAEDCK